MTQQPMRPRLRCEFDYSHMRLIRAANELRRKVYASLPWGMRLAHALLGLKFAADAKSFGRFAYGMLHLYRVLGLPRAPLIPTTIREIDKLPRDYGLEFGNRAQGIARTYLPDEDDVEEVLSVVALKLISSESLKKGVQGKNIREAENYILRAVQNQALDFMRSKKVRRYEEIDDLIRESGSWEGLDELIPERERERIKSELESAVSPKIMPDLPLYFDLLLDGVSNKAIAEERMLPSLRNKPMSQQGLAKYRDKIKDVLRRHFEVQAVDQF